MESLIDIIDQIAGPRVHADPFQKFRRRTFVIMLLLLCLVCWSQALAALIAEQSGSVMVMMLVLGALTLCSLYWTRHISDIEHTAMVILCFLVMAGAVGELLAGKSPNTPLLYWSPVIIFGGFVFCGLRRGMVVALCVLLSALTIIIGPFMMEDVRLFPGGGSPEAYRKRLLVTVALCHAFPLIILGMYERFFTMCHQEARDLLDALEKSKDRVFVGRLARHIVAEIEPELQRLEQGYTHLLAGERDPSVMEAVLASLRQLAQMTRRYEPLSLQDLNALDPDLLLQNFPDLAYLLEDLKASDV